MITGAAIFAAGMVLGNWAMVKLIVDYDDGGQAAKGIWR